MPLEDIGYAHLVRASAACTGALAPSRGSWLTTLSLSIGAIVAGLGLDRVSKASAESVGLLTFGERIRTYVLIRTDRLLDDPRTFMDNYDAVKSSIVGAIRAYTSPRPRVSSVAAIKGYGPLLYEVAMSDLGSLAPDPGKVSDSASSVWKKFFEREDVAKTLSHQHLAGKEWLDYRYSIKDPIETAGLHQVADHAIVDAAAASGALPEDVRARIHNAATAFVSERIK